MKKILCLLLAVFMLTSLCGCFGSKNDDDVRGEIISGDVGENEVKTENEPEFSLGKVASNTYNNDFLGLSCTLPSEWVFYTDEQILEINNIAADYYDEDVAKQLENATVIYDMYAINEIEGSNVNVNLEKLNAVQMIGLDIKTTLESQTDAIKSAYENMGYTDTDVSYQKVTVDGKEFDGLKINAKMQGVDFYGVCFTFKKSNYLANVTVCSVLNDKSEAILSCFKVK